MSDIVQNLINNSLSDGARPTKYKIDIVAPAVLQDKLPSTELDILCKATNLPAMTAEPLMIKYKGRNVPTPGQETFAQNIELTFYMEETHQMRQFFQSWLKACSFETYSDITTPEYESLKSQMGTAAQNIYGTITLEQLNFAADRSSSSYTFHKCFVKELGQIVYDSSSVSGLLEYTVTLTYLYYDGIVIDSEGNSTSIANGIIDKVQDTITGIVKSAIGFMPGLDSLNDAAAQANAAIQDAGKSIGSTLDDWSSISSG